MKETEEAVFETHIPEVTLWRRGKVRDVYDLGDALLIVSTDRISAFDVVLPTPIPGKGRVLNHLSLFWFRLLADGAAHHVLSDDPCGYDTRLAPWRSVLAERSMVVQRTRPLPVECVVRGYLAGSGWKEYGATGEVCGLRLPPGLSEAERLDPPLFTPSTKATEGHDENISFERVENELGSDLARRVRDLSLELYARAREHAAARGLILADTKFEFGLGADGRLLWIDEALTPDSSRFWPADTYRPGQGQPSFDKQYVRDHLEAQRWNKQPPAPALPDDVVTHTRTRYQEALERLTGPPTAPAPRSGRAR